MQTSEDRCAGELARAPLSKLFLPVVLVVSNLKTHGEKRRCAPGPPHEPIPISNWKLATLGLATFPHWQHFRPHPVGRGLRPRRPVGRAHTLARPSGCLRQCSLRGFASSVHVLGGPPPGLHKPHDITSRATVSMPLHQRGQPLCPPPSRFLATLAPYPRSHSRAVTTLIVTPSSEIVSWSWSVISSKSLQPVFFATLQQTLS